MKKIISVLIVAVMLVTCLLATIPTSAATKTLELKWNTFEYEARKENGSVYSATNFAKEITITKDATKLSAKRIGGDECRSYISTTKLTITATTKYTYEVMAKNNTSLKYSGIPFAIGSDGKVYFLYGSFENKNDTSGAPNATSAYMVPAKGAFNSKILGGKSETNSIFFKKITVTDGFASLKFEYNGFDVKIYTKNSSGSYEQIGQTVTLPAGSKLAFGVHTRDGGTSSDRSATIKNGKITALNDESVGYLTPNTNNNNNNTTNDKVDNGADDLKAKIAKAEVQYTDADYTADTIATLKTAITNAKKVVENTASTAAQVTAANDALEAAISGLKTKSADTSKLKELISKAKALKKDDWSTISYTMLMKAVESAEEIVDKTGVMQTEIDNTLTTLQARMDSLVASDKKADSTEKVPTIGDSTDNNVGVEDVTVAASESASDNASIEVPAKEGCGSAIVTTAVVVSIVAGLGTALVVKKKD